MDTALDPSPFRLYSNGLNLNGEGSKAVSMGGAFVGLADDYSAIYWNPAGLTQIKDTVVPIFLSNVIPFQTYKFSAAGIDAKTKFMDYLSPGLGFIKPLSKDVVIGIFAYVPSGSGANWDGNDLKNLVGGKVYTWKSLVGIVAVSPSIAVKISDQLSFGAALNIDYGLLKMQKGGALGQYKEDLNGWTVGGTFGLLFKPVDKFSIGVTYKTPLSAKISGDVTIPGAAAFGLPTKDTGHRTVKWPMWLGGGVAFKPTAKLTFTMDAQWTNWKKMQDIPITFTNAGWIAYIQNAAKYVLNWKDTVQLRFGMEYKLSQSFALRGGYYHDPNPGPNSTQSVMLPEITYNFITFGFGYNTKHITLDFATEYGMGKKKNVSTAEAIPGVGMPGIHNVNIFVPNIAVTFKF